MMKKRKFTMPHAMIIVSIILLFMTVLTWIVPSSIVTTNEDGEKVIHYSSSFDDDGNVIADTGTDPKGLWDLIMAPIQGFHAASDVIVTILVCAAFLKLLDFVGAMNAGIGLLLKKFKSTTLIAILMFVFSAMGTVYGSWEELPAYAMIIIPLFVLAGYDVITGILVVMVGAKIGLMSSVINPYSVGTAISTIGNPDLTMGSGMIMRFILWLLLYVVGTMLVIRYANSVKADPSRSIVAGVADIDTRVNVDIDSAPEMTKARKWSLIVFGIMILMTVIGYIPWSSIATKTGTMSDVVNGGKYWLMEHAPVIGNLLGVRTFNEFGNWYFDEFSLVFLAGSVIIAVINKISLKDFVREFIAGCKEMMSVCLVLSVARGIAIIMGTKTQGMCITFIYWLQNLLTSVPLWAFVVAAVFIYVLIGFCIQSTSSVAGITMSIFGAVAMALFASTTVGAVGGQVALISSFTMGLNFTASLYPTATVMGIIGLANVPYDRFIKIMIIVMLPILLAGTLFVSVAPYIGLI